MKQSQAIPSSAEELANKINESVQTILDNWFVHGYIPYPSEKNYERLITLVQAWVEISYQKWYSNHLGADNPGQPLLADPAQVTRANAILECVRDIGGDTDAVMFYLMMSYGRIEARLALRQSRQKP